eukprot:scaffold3.g6321.t1
MTAPSLPQEPQAVASVPRLFVGQVPTDKTEDDLTPIFAPFGTVEKVTLVRGPEGRSKGCAMVQFGKWAEAEAAMESVNGTSPLENGKGRPLVVHFANPRRMGSSQAAEVAIAPRKVFVGQIPKSAGEAEVLAVFAPYGEVESVNILKSKGLHAGCAFVQFKKWASCEAAIAALHEQARKSAAPPHAKRPPARAQCLVVMPGCEHPLVVKFADAKRSDNPALKRGVLPGVVGLGLPAPFGSPHHHPLLGGYAELGGLGPPPHLGAMGSLPMAGFGGLLPSAGGPPHHGLGVPTPIALSGHRANGLGSVGGSSENLLDSSTDGDGPSGLAPLAGSIGSGLAFAGEPGGLRLPSNGSAGSLHSMALPGMGPGGYGLPLHHHEGGMHGMMAGGGMGMQMMAAAAAAVAAGVPQQRPVKVGRGVTDPAAYAHKLFIGQVPFEAGEHDLWALFSPVGEVLELAVLRSQGRSKGCAFLTYASRQQALAAINAFHGRPVGHNKRLVVKFADNQKAAAAAAAPTP